MSTGAGLSYLDTADHAKPSVAFLHGFLGSAEDWQDVIDALHPDFRCIAFDLPGHGRSVAVDDSLYPMEPCAQHIVELLDRLEIPKCHLVGYSMGGRLALFLLTHYQRRFDRSVLESTSPGLKTVAERHARQVQDEALAERVLSIPIEHFIDEWYRQPLFQSLQSDQSLVRDLTRRRVRNLPEGLAKSLRHMGTGAQPSLWRNLSLVNVPLLYLAGELDHKYSLLAAEMASLTPGSRAEIFADCGHTLHFERPDIYISRVRAFLTA